MPFPYTTQPYPEPKVLSFWQDMYLQTLHLRHFRNYEDQQVIFQAPKTILVGDNAQGKSNLLEAVELFATLKSHRTSHDRDLIRNSSTAGHISATLERELGTDHLDIILRQGSRRTTIRNGEKLRRQMDLLGTLNAVQFSSLDLELVRGGPAQRRVWIDTLLMQLEPIYAHLLQQYSVALKQRNALLKQIQPHSTQTHSGSDNLRSGCDPTQLAIWDAQLATLGTRVIRRRARGIKRLSTLAQQWHTAISGHQEHLEIHYVPNVPTETDDPSLIQQTFLDKIQQRSIVEQRQQTSLVGPHRDDIEFVIDNTPARQYGSQGQQRTLILALKLAELMLIAAVVGEPPLLLLDDVLAELDLHRQNQLLDAIQDRFQTLITTTHLGAFDAQWLQSSQTLSVRAGQVSSVAS